MGMFTWSATAENCAFPLKQVGRRLVVHSTSLPSKVRSKLPKLLPSARLSFSFCLFWLPPHLAVPGRAGMRLTPGQLEKYQDVLEKLLAELLQDTPDGTARRLISALGILPFPLLTGSSSRRYLYSSEGLLCHVCSLYRVLRYPIRSRVHALLGRLFAFLGCCLCPTADIGC